MLRLVPQVPPPVSAETAPAQGEMPFAVVEGRPVTELPRDLYIPPARAGGFPRSVRRSARSAALSDPPAKSRHPRRSDRRDLEAVRLVHRAHEGNAVPARGRVSGHGRNASEIKSRMLLPRSADGEDDEEDPRAELVRRLQEYERFKPAASDIDLLERLERDVLQGVAEVVEKPITTKLPAITSKELLFVSKRPSNGHRCLLTITYSGSRCLCARDAEYHPRHCRPSVTWISFGSSSSHGGKNGRHGDVSSDPRVAKGVLGGRRTGRAVRADSRARRTICRRRRKLGTSLSLAEIQEMDENSERNSDQTRTGSCTDSRPVARLRSNGSRSYSPRRERQWTGRSSKAHSTHSRRTMKAGASSSERSQAAIASKSSDR